MATKTDYEIGALLRDLEMTGLTYRETSQFGLNDLKKLLIMKTSGCSLILFKGINTSRVEKLIELNNDGYTWGALKLVFEEYQRRGISANFIDDLWMLKQKTPAAYKMSKDGYNRKALPAAPQPISSLSPPPPPPPPIPQEPSTMTTEERSEIIKNAGFCAFCQGEFEDQEIVITNCKHVFCEECFNDEDNTTYKTECAICRKFPIELI